MDMTDRTTLIRELLLQGSYSVHDLAQHLARIQKRKPWSIAAIETSLRSLPVTKWDNLYTIVWAVPVNKSAFKRYLILIRELKSVNYFNPLSRFVLADKINQQLGMNISPATVEKDIRTLRHDEDLSFFVPIRARNVGYWIEDDYLLSEHIAKTWKIWASLV